MDACRRRSWTRCELLQAAVTILDRRGGAAGRHHHRPASNASWSSSYLVELFGIDELEEFRRGMQL
eukprot:1964571-Pyramimonas_sp.AAC.1